MYLTASRTTDIGNTAEELGREAAMNCD